MARVARIDLQQCPCCALGRLDCVAVFVRPGSVYALTKAAERNYPNVHTDVGRLEELGLIERTGERSVSVPFEAVEILVPLAHVA